MNIDLLIIGDGIASKLFQFYAPKEMKIMVLSDPEFAPPCSFNTTSVVSLFGTRKGLSDLGDLNVDSFNAFEDFIKEHAPHGVEKALHFHLDPEGPAALMKRFGSAKAIEQLTSHISLPEKTFMAQENSYTVYPNEFLSWLDEQNHKNLPLLEKRVMSVRQFEKMDTGFRVGDGEKSITSSKVLLCMGAYTKIFESLFEEYKVIERSKIVSGSYLHFHHVNWGKEDLIFTLRKTNLIYRANDQSLLLGGTHGPEGILLPYVRELKNDYEYFQKILGSYLRWPRFKNAEMISGIRHKGQRRRPFYGELDKNLFALISLYKNGFSYPFFMAPKLHKLI